MSAVDLIGNVLCAGVTAFALVYLVSWHERIRETSKCCQREVIE